MDDDPEMVASASALLARDGIHVTSAPDKTEAAAQLSLNTFDLILLDLGLPEERDGFELLQQIKQSPNNRRLPVIILTAWSNAEHKVRALDMGATDYVTKPFEGAELRARVRSALRTQRLQKELAAANEQLQSARDHAEVEAKAKAGLLAFKSHEIRSFMNGILPNAGFLGGTSLSEEQREYVETIRQSSENILSIVNDILDFSRIESGRLELENQPFDLRKCVEDALDTLALKAGEKGLDLSYAMADGIPARVRGDVARLRQILVNLIGNAVKFTAAGEVALEVIGEESSQIHFTVTDTGIGIPKTKQAELFNPFCQADASTSRLFGGSGLGLSISRRLTELMGGRLWVDSEAGKGAAFHFSLCLPAVSDSADTSFAKLRSSLAAMQLLVIDDNPRIQKLLCDLASRWGCQAHAVSSADEALALLNSGSEFDVVLLDSSLGNQDPAAVATKLRLARGSARTRFVLLSMAGTRSQSNLFVAHLTKPLKPAHVRDTLALLTSGANPQPQSRSGLSVPASGRLAEGYPMNVLLCDDNAVNQKVASRMLSQLGYAPDVAASGMEALQAFEQKHYDLVLMDVQMPEMDGLETTAKLRERQKARPEQPGHPLAPVIVAMTASAMPGDRDRCLKAGMDDYLSKPVRPEDLRKVIEKWARQLVPAQMAEPDSPVVHTPTRPAAPRETGQGQAILDWERLMDLADNDRDILQELVSLYIAETEKQMEQLGAAVASRSSLEVKRLAHKCAGGSATIGVGRLVPLLRELETRGEIGNLEGTSSLYERAREEFQILLGHLQLHPNGVLESNVQ